MMMAHEKLGPPSPDTGTQTPSTAVTVWRFADAPQSAQKLLPVDDGRHEGRWIALFPTDAVAGWKGDAYWLDRKVPVWAVGWERGIDVAYSLDGASDPRFFKLADGRCLVIGCA